MQIKQVKRTRWVFAIEGKSCLNPFQLSREICWCKLEKEIQFFVAHHCIKTRSSFLVYHGIPSNILSIGVVLFDFFHQYSVEWVRVEIEHQCQVRMVNQQLPKHWSKLNLFCFRNRVQHLKHVLLVQLWYRAVEYRSQKRRHYFSRGISSLLETVLLFDHDDHLIHRCPEKQEYRFAVVVVEKTDVSGSKLTNRVRQIFDHLFRINFSRLTD